MILRRGDTNNLIGNGIIYWNIIGYNAVVPGYSIFAINFAISPLPVDGKLLTATFPPVPMQSVEELFSKLKGAHCDVIYAGEMEFPVDEDDLTSFYNKEIDTYNKVIEEYVEEYKDKFESAVEYLSEHDKLDLLETLSRKMREEIREEVQEKEEKEEREARGEVKPKVSTKKMVNVISKLDKEKKYDIDNLLSVLFVPGIVGDKLVSLYTKKFFAIYYEDYEKASSIKSQIIKLEQKL